MIILSTFQWFVGALLSYFAENFDWGLGFLVSFWWVGAFSIFFVCVFIFFLFFFILAFRKISNLRNFLFFQSSGKFEKKFGVGSGFNDLFFCFFKLFLSSSGNFVYFWPFFYPSPSEILISEAWGRGSWDSFYSSIQRTSNWEGSLLSKSSSNFDWGWSFLCWFSVNIEFFITVFREFRLHHFCFRFFPASFSSLQEISNSGAFFFRVHFSSFFSFFFFFSSLL